MSDSSFENNLSFLALPQEEKELIRRHTEISAWYTDTNLENWSEMNEGNIRTAEQVVDVLMSHGVIPEARSGSKSLIVSSSSNSGLIENELSRRLGNKYMIIASDRANIQRVEGGAIPLQADASSMPFKLGTADVYLDLLGALWHEAGHDLANWDDTKGEDAFKLLDLYKKYLNKNGLLIVDTFTGIMVDTILSKAHRSIDGFSAPTFVGSGRYRMRIYRKQSTVEDIQAELETLINE